MKSLPDDPPAQIESLTVAIQVPFEPVRTDLLPNALGGFVEKHWTNHGIIV